MTFGARVTGRWLAGRIDKYLLFDGFIVVNRFAIVSRFAAGDFFGGVLDSFVGLGEYASSA